MVVGTLLPLLPKDSWWVRSFDFPRLQIVTILAAVLVVHLLFFKSYQAWEILYLLTLILSIGYQGYMIYPYTPLSSIQVESFQDVQSTSKISLLFANVQMQNRQAKPLKDLIKKADPDIVLAAETDEWWIDKLAQLKESYPFVVEQPQDNCYGMALYSRKELYDTEIKFLVEKDIPSIHCRVQLSEEHQMELRCLHPRPPFITGDDTSSERDAEILIVGREIKDIERPAVVLGDLNDVAWSKTNNLFQDISGLLDPRIGRGLYNTFHASYPFIRFPLDHSFHTDHFRLIDFKRLSYIGSDHFPVLIELSYEPDATYSQPEPQADQEEQKKTEEKIEKEV